MKALILTWENFQDQEVVYPFYRLKEETDEVHIMANVGKISWHYGCEYDIPFVD